MNFRCSPFDVLKLLECSNRVYVAFKDANGNSELQVNGIMREFISFHSLLTELCSLMKQYGHPIPFPCNEFEKTLNICEKTLQPDAELFFDKKINIKKSTFTVRYIGTENETDSLRKRITGHYQTLNMWISFLHLRFSLEATKQTQRLLDATSLRTMALGSRSYSTGALSAPYKDSPLALPTPSEHPLHSQWRVFERWLQSEDEQIARLLSLEDGPTVAPTEDEQSAAMLYYLRRQIDDAILIEENREKWTTTEKRSHLSPSDTVEQNVRNMPPSPPRMYILEKDDSNNFIGFDNQMDSSSATIQPAPATSSLSSSHSGSSRFDSSFSFSDWKSPLTVRAVSHDSVSTNQNSVSFPPNSRPLVSGPAMSTESTTPEHLVSHFLLRSSSRTSLAIAVLGEAALDWKFLCRTVEVERKSLRYASENKQCDVRWRYREDTGISLRAVYCSRQDGRLKLWTEQHFPATGPSIPLTTTYPDGSVSINFPQRSFGTLDKSHTDIKYTFNSYESAKKFQTLLYTNNNTDPAELKYDRPVLTISTDKNRNECRGQNIRLWHCSETYLQQDSSITCDVLVLLFYTNALGEKGHWVEEPHSAFEWLSESIYRKESEKLKLIFSKESQRRKSYELFKARKSSIVSDERRKSSAFSDAEPKGLSIFSQKRKDSLEIPELERSSTSASPSSSTTVSVTSVKDICSRSSAASRSGNLNRFGYSELEIKFQSKKDRRAFLDIWKLYTRKSSVTEPLNLTMKETSVDVNIRPLISDGGNDASFAHRPAPVSNVEIKEAMVSVFARSSILTPLYKVALQLMQKGRLVNDFQRLLTVFHRNMARSGEPVAARKLTTILRSEERHDLIAQKIILRFLSHSDAFSIDNDLARLEEQDNRNFAYLDTWLSNQPVLDEKFGDQELDYAADLHACSSDGDFAEYPRLNLFMRSLVRSRPFQDMLMGMKELLLPHGLLYDILSIPRKQISYSSGEGNLALASFQRIIEDITALPWNWWPLPPRMRPLKSGETRVHWRCFCGTMRWRELREGQRDILDELLKESPSVWHRPLLCASLKTFTSNGFDENGSHQYSGTPVSSTPSQTGSGTQVYNNASACAQPIGNRAMAARPGGTKALQPLSGASQKTQTSATTTTGCNKQRWVIFGVSGARPTPEVDQIGEDHLSSDPMFLRKLRRRHRELRGWIRTHFSYWQLNHWEFVRFKRLPLLPPCTIDIGNDLPISTDYEYDPRPPDATLEKPGITQHEFEVYVRLCLDPCWARFFPLANHVCHSPKDSAVDHIDKLPKFNKRLEQDIQAYEYVWGIQARYVVSGIRVLLIHIFILLTSIGGWIWWQRGHVDDLQGAAVPFASIFLLISIFWSATGVLKDLR